MHDKRFATRAIRAGEERDPSTNAHNTLIYQTATFSFETAKALTAAIDAPFDNYFYSRTAKSTTAVLETKLAALEGAEAALVTSSGMGAVALVVMICAEAADPILVAEQDKVERVCYPGYKCTDDE